MKINKYDVMSFIVSFIFGAIGTIEFGFMSKKYIALSVILYVTWFLGLKSGEERKK